MSRCVLAAALAVSAALSSCGSERPSALIGSAPDTVSMVVDWDLRAGVSAAADSFGLVTGVAEAPTGEIYVTDRLASKLWVIDDAGQLVESVGREGEGPGEFTYPTGPGIAPDGSLIVRDVYRVSRFGLDSLGVLDRFDDSFEGPLYAHWVSLRATRVDSSGVLYYPGFGYTDELRVQPFLIRFGSEGSPMDTVWIPEYPTAPGRIPFVRLGARGGRMLPGLDRVPFAPVPAWDITPQATVLSGPGDAYWVAETSFLGDTLAVFSRDIEPRQIPEPESEDSLAALSLRLDSILPQPR